MSIRSPRGLVSFFALSFGLAALAAEGCSSSSGGGGTGGVSATGGAASGGTTGSGGVTGTGGATSGTGGVTGTGGSSTSTGGTIGSGGVGVGGATTGGGGSGSGTGGGIGTGGRGGATNCAGHAVSLATNIAGGSDPAMARVDIDFGANSPDLPVLNSNRTIEFWAYVPSSTWVANTNTMFFYGANNRIADGFGLDFGSNMGTMGTIDPFTNAIFDNDNQPSGITATTSQWVHFAMTWDGAAVRAFVNGVEKSTKLPPATGQRTLMTARSVFTLGGYPGESAYFNGYFDELRVWTVARTAAEITSTMHQSLVGNEPNLTGYWKFEDPSGTMAADSVTSAGHTQHPGVLRSSGAGTLPTLITPTTPAPINCP